MKLQIKALSATLILASLLGACSSVNSSNPSVEDPSVNSGIELDSSEGYNGLEANEESLELESAEMDNSDLEAGEESLELESAEMDNSDLEASEESLELESAEMDNSDLEASEESLELESAEMENYDLETAGQETPEIESSEAPLESQGSELILPVEDAVQTPTESEAAENPTLEPGE